MSENITVVTEVEALDEAYDLGRQMYNDMTAADIAEAYPIRPTEHGQYDTSILQELRAIAGFDDSGYGTYNQNADIALIECGNEDDVPAEATIIESRMFLDDVIEAYQRGAIDTVHHTVIDSDEYDLEDLER